MCMNEEQPSSMVLLWNYPKIVPQVGYIKGDSSFVSLLPELLLVPESLPELLPLPGVPHHIHLRGPLSLLLLNTPLQLQATQEVSWQLWREALDSQCPAGNIWFAGEANHWANGDSSTLGKINPDAGGAVKLSSRRSIESNTVIITRRAILKL